MRPISDFLLMRPVVGMAFLRFVWVCFLIVYGGSFIWSVLGSTSYVTLTTVQLLQVLWLSVFPIMQILIVRVLLEAAGAILLGSEYRRTVRVA